MFQVSLRYRRNISPPLVRFSLLVFIVFGEDEKEQGKKEILGMEFDHGIFSWSL